jgi:hypothetical protein
LLVGRCELTRIGLQAVRFRRACRHRFLTSSSVGWAEAGLSSAHAASCSTGNGAAAVRADSRSPGG